MELLAESPAPPSDTPCAALGELVIQNGPERGLRRTLIGLLTFIGRAEWCDLRVEAEDVNPWHCVVARGETGLFLRDLHSETGTRVNGRAVTACSLSDGDVLTVGPLELRIHWPGQPTASAAESDGQREALLERQYQHVLEVREEIRKERDGLDLDRDRYEERVAQVHQDLARDRLVMAERQKDLRKQAERLWQVRLRLKHRWQRRRAAEQARLQAREASLDEGQRNLEVERAQLNQERLRINGDAELGRRELQAAWDAFRQEQRVREEALAARETALRGREESVQARERAVADAQRDLARRSRQWEKDRLSRQQELEGLESRVQNYRRKLMDLEHEAAELEARAAGRLNYHAGSGDTAPSTLPLPPPSSSPLEADFEAPLATLETLAGELADQRLYLAEQCGRLAEARDEWRLEREAVVSELEVLGAHLSQREDAVLAHEQAALALEQEVRERRAHVERLRAHVEAERARLSAQMASWEGERDRLVAEVEAREEAADDHLRELETVRERWQVLHQENLNHLRAERAAWQELRQAGMPHDLGDRLHQQAEDVVARELELTRGQTAWERLQTLAEMENTKLRRQAEGLHRQSERYTRQIRELREEVDHLASFLLDEPAQESPRLVQAA